MADSRPCLLDLQRLCLRTRARICVRAVRACAEEHEREVSGWAVLDDINLGIADESRKTSARHPCAAWGA